MKIFVMGAGGQGGPCVSILARDKDISEIVLADIDLDLATKVKEKINSPKIKVCKVDASSVEQIAKAANGVDVIIDLVIIHFAPNVMEAAVKAGAHYVNTAFGEPFFEQFVKGKPLEFNNEFKKKKLTGVMGCGMAPGFLNIVAKSYTDKLDKVKSVKFRLGKKKLGLGKYDDITTPWNPGWSPKQALLDCAEPAYVFRDGKYEEVPPYAEIEEWHFPDPVGKMLVSHHSHEEPISFPVIIGKGIEYCDFKYYVTNQAATLVSMGLASEEEIEVKGTKIKPMDVVMALIPKPGNSYLNEDVEKLDDLDKTFFVSMMIEVIGEKDDKEIIYSINCPKLTAPGRELHQLFGTSLINVALPAVIGAKMVVEGVENGVIFAEQLNTNRFLELFKATGIPYEWKEEKLMPILT